MQSLSDLRARQRQAGAVFAAVSSGLPGDDRPPLHFGDPRAEYVAAHGTAALFDWTDHGLIELTGSDRVRFLHSFCTNDIKRLIAGSGCEAFVTNVKGRILGHLWIEAGDTALRLDFGTVATERLLTHLERYIINEDVVVTDRSSDLGELLVIGPRAAESLVPLSADVRRLAPLQHLDVAGPSSGIRVSRRGVDDLPAYVVCGPHGVLGEAWEKIKEAGARPAGATIWSALRIEAGLPIWGVDLTDENLAQEAGRSASAISFTKGCYLGQEPIARLDAMGHVNRELRSLRITGEAIPSPGAGVFADAAGSAAVGGVTSAAMSFGSDGPVALALVRSSVSAPGSAVFVEAATTLAPATVFWAPAAERGT
jgi:folate-binding protein YgfZ